MLRWVRKRTTIGLVAAIVGVFGVATLAPVGSAGAPAGWFELDVGAGEGPASLIVFIPGSGCDPVENQTRRFFAGLAGHWRILVQEKPGLEGAPLLGCSAAFHEATTYDQIIARQTAFAAKALRDNAAAPVRMLVGYSEGGTVAPYVAASTPGFTHLLVAAAGALPGRTEVSETLANSFGELPKRLLLDAIDEHPHAVDRYLLGESYRYWTSLFALQPMDAYRRLNLPIYMAHGREDRIVPAAGTLFAQQSFEAEGRTNLRVDLLDGAGHGLRMNNLPERQAFWRRAGDWIASTSGA